MKTLLWHVDKMIVEVKDKALSSPPTPKDKHFEMGEGVVVFITLEKGDDEKEDLLSYFTQDIEKYIEEVGATRVLLYPYAHLSSDLLNISKSIKLFDALVDFVSRSLKEEGINVYSSPFGWYKSFEVKVKGHPLSELSKRY